MKPVATVLVYVAVPRHYRVVRRVVLDLVARRPGSPIRAVVELDKDAKALVVRVSRTGVDAFSMTDHPLADIEKLRVEVVDAAIAAYEAEEMFDRAKRAARRKGEPVPTRAAPPPVPVAPAPSPDIFETLAGADDQ